MGKSSGGYGSLIMGMRHADQFGMICSIAGGRRISEGSLLLLALLGGTPGAFAARHMFRHKTRKQPFATILWLIALIQIGVLAGWISTAMPLPSAEALFQGKA